MLSLVIGILTTMMLAAGVLTVLRMRRNRDVTELVLQLKIRDGLLSEASLADLPIALRVHRPLAPWSPSLLRSLAVCPPGRSATEWYGWRSGKCRGAARVFGPSPGSPSPPR